MNIKTRFAPSPSGSLHLGNLRAALIPFLFARKNKGVFFLRIDNTNKLLFKKKNVKKIINDLNDFKLKSNYKIFQSKRIRIYIKYSLLLLRKKKAYLKDNAIYYKVDRKGKVIFKDYIRKNIKIKRKEINDFVLVRSNGFSTFNFACAIDDFLEGVNFVFRGEEHISNTVKQIIILRNFGVNNINYSHISNITDRDGKKISKRSKFFSIRSILNKGILRTALINYICNLGFSNEDKILTSLKKIIKNFDIKYINLSQTKYDFDKILWYNKEHICKIENFRIINFLKKKVHNSLFFKKSIPFLKKRASVLEDFYNLYDRYLLNLFKNKKVIDREIYIFFRRIRLLKLDKKGIISYLKEKNIYHKLNFFFFNKKKNVPSVIDIICILKKKIFF
ncbi:Glutamate-tRNA ligase (Glu-tRNA) [Candidatus Vidania fulgoroideae]|nr:Glutamate-tRNA ligase (Glu-tRNA) [Candidatus Vidania fulgoroideae]